MVAALKNQDISLFLSSSLHLEPEQRYTTVQANVTAIKYQQEIMQLHLTMKK